MRRPGACPRPWAGEVSFYRRFSKDMLRLMFIGLIHELCEALVKMLSLMSVGLMFIGLMSAGLMPTGCPPA